MIKKLLSRSAGVAIATTLLVSCIDNELCYQNHPHGQTVKVEFEWPSGITPPASGMRLNLFALGPHNAFGITDVPSENATINVPYNTAHMALCYDYFGSDNTRFQDETIIDNIQAYCTPLTRATYTRAFPNQNTVAEPGVLLTDKIESFSVVKSDTPLVMKFRPVDVVKTYTFVIEDVRGAKYITDTRIAISGQSGSYHMVTKGLAATESTVLAKAAKDGPGERITGSFRTFGRIDKDNILTVEILYPSATEGIIHKSWDVTEQMKVGTQIKVSANIDIIPDSGGGGSGFEADVEEWEDERVPLPM